MIDDDPMPWFLVVANYETGVPEITQYHRHDKRALEVYSELEARHRGNDLIEVVLISAAHETALRFGYPHYFGTTRTTPEKALRRLKARAKSKFGIVV